MIALCIAGSPRSTHASWPHDPVTGNLPLCTAAHAQSVPVIASDDAGGAILVWRDDRDGPRSDLYAQRVDGRGAPRWAANGVPICVAQSFQYGASMIPDGAGGAIVAWHDGRSQSSYDIYAQRIDAAGVPQWAANGVPLCVAPRDQVFPRIVSDGAGGAIVAWQDDRGSGWRIYAQRVTGAGAVAWTAGGVALSNAAGSQVLPAMTGDGAGGAIVAWQDRRNGNDDIFARRIDASGAPLWPGAVALCAAVDDQQVPVIAPDGAGGAIVTWQDRRGGAEWDIEAQRVSPDGFVLWAADGLPVSLATGDQVRPAIVTDAAGGAIVVWTDGRNGAADVYAERVDAIGAHQWALDGIPLCTAFGDQDSLTVVADGAGGAFVAWQDGRSGVHDDIFGQQVWDPLESTCRHASLSIL